MTKNNESPEGFLPLCKPPGMTSHDLTAWTKKTWGLAKVGHCGTLDPLAVGALVLCVNRATRWADQVAGSDKRYRAEIRFGLSTSTGDAAGRPTLKTNGCVDPNLLGEVFKIFTGVIKQKPPMTSAVKFGGKKLYKLARKGLEIDRPEREVRIDRIELLNFQEEKDGCRALIDVACGKGVYIRTLAEDMGKTLDQAAHLSFLCRLAVGPFRLEECLAPEEMHGESSLDRFLWPVTKTLERMESHAIRGGL